MHQSRFASSAILLVAVLCSPVSSPDGRVHSYSRTRFGRSDGGTYLSSGQRPYRLSHRKPSDASLLRGNHRTGGQQTRSGRIHRTGALPGAYVVQGHPEHRVHWNYEKEKAHLDRITSLYEEHFSETDPEKRKAIYAEINKESQLAAAYAIPNEIDKLYKAMGGTGAERRIPGTKKRSTGSICQPTGCVTGRSSNPNASGTPSSGCFSPNSRPSTKKKTGRWTTRTGSSVTRLRICFTRNIPTDSRPRSERWNT